MPATLTQWIMAIILILSSLGVVFARKPVYASLSFLVTLLTLSALYLQLDAQFIAVMQVLVYAGAILVIFMYIIILFQDAYQQLSHYKPKADASFLYLTAGAFFLSLLFLGKLLINVPNGNGVLPQDFGTVKAIGKLLYVDFFFPFEATILLFLVAVIGALYIGRKEEG